MTPVVAGIEGIFQLTSPVAGSQVGAVLTLLLILPVQVVPD